MCVINTSRIRWKISQMLCGSFWRASGGKSVWKREKKRSRLLGESSLSVTFKQANQSLVSSRCVYLREFYEQIGLIGKACPWESNKINE